jgi:hypothetical protein
MTLALMIDWYGPLKSVGAAKNTAKEWGAGEVLYLATGRRRYQRTSGLQYVGISNDISNRFNDPKHKITTAVVADLSIWIGFVVSHAAAGRRAGGSTVAHSRGVEQAEWVVAYFMAMPLNRKKRRQPPKESSILVNRWFNAKTEERRAHRGHAAWPDFIEYDKERDTAALAWFGMPKRKTYSAAEIGCLALKPSQ